MSDQPPRPEQSMVDGLRGLANPGRGKAKPLDDYKAHLDLADPILRVLRIEAAVPPERRELLLRKVFAAVAAQARVEVHAALSNAGSNPDKLLEPGKHPAFKSAAAGELLGCFDDSARARVRKKYIPDDSEWNKRFKGSDNTGELAYRRTYAGAWIGGQTHKNVGRSHKQIELFRSFEAALLVYIDQRREQLRAFVLEQDEPIMSDDPTSAVVDTPTSTAPEPPALSRPRNGPRRPSFRPSDPELQRWFEQLATEVHRQLNDEDSNDKVIDPIPMPVRWSITDQYLVDHPSNVWSDADDPSPLDAGTVETAIDLFESIPSGRLVVLGHGGAGKTVLARRLALELLERSAGSAVPVIFRLSSWDLTERVSLRDWMAGQLMESYPALKATSHNRQGGRTTVAAALVRGRYVLPILDGLDELAASHRTEALRRINGALHRGDPAVLTSRPPEYTEAAQVGDVVTGAVVIQLHDLTPDDLTAYLPRTTPVSGRQVDETKWAPVLAQVHQTHSTGTSALAEVLTTPLMASLARAIYSETGADPAELLDTERFPSSGAITDHLLDALVQVKYDDLPQDRDTTPWPRWKPDDAARWLGFLAIMMSAQGTHNFAWWKPGQRRSMRLFTWPTNRLLILTYALAAGLDVWWMLRPVAGAGLLDTTGSVIALVVLAIVIISVALFSGSNAEPREVSSPRWWWRRIYSGLSLPELARTPVGREMITFCLTYLLGLLIVVVATPDYFAALLPAGRVDRSLALFFLAAVPVYCLTFLGLLAAMQPTLIELGSPGRIFRKDRHAAVARGTYYGIGISGLCAAMWVPYGRVGWLAMTPVLVATAIVTALASSAYGAWLVRRVGFAIRRWLPRPWKCMEFLDDGCRRGILRRSGGVYQFRHALLQERLAAEFLDRHAAGLMQHTTILHVRAHLAVSRLEANGDPDAVERELRELIETHRRHRRSQYGVLSTWDLLIHTLHIAGRRDDALNEARSFERYATDIETRGWGRQWYWQYYSRRVLADLLSDAGFLAEADAQYSEVLQVAMTRWGQDDPDVVEIRNKLAELHGGATAQLS